MTMTKKCVMYAGLALALVIPARSSFAQVQQLPISSFVNAQDLCLNFSWSDPVNGNILFFDALGLRNTCVGLNLGTSVSGGVTIRALPDGTQEEVSVTIHTKDALCVGFDVNGDPAFGRTAAEIAGGAPASLGDGLTTLRFIQPVGAPLPPLEQIGEPPNILELQSTSIMCSHGELRPSGETGFAQTTQTGLGFTGVPGGCPPEKDADCFPAEKVQFKPTGQ
jgi:hypothetical protein